MKCPTIVQLGMGCYVIVTAWVHAMVTSMTIGYISSRAMILDCPNDPVLSVRVIWKLVLHRLTLFWNEDLDLIPIGTPKY